MRGHLQLTTNVKQPSLISFSHFLYINSCQLLPAETGTHQFSKMFHFSNMNQSSFKGAFMFMLVQHLCTPILYSVIIRALPGPLISSDPWLWRLQPLTTLEVPQKVRYGAEPTQNRRRPKQRDRLPFLCIINEPQQWSAPGLLIGHVLTWLLWIIIQGGKDTNNNMGTIKCKRQSHRTQGSLSPQKHSLVPNRKSCYPCKALNGFSCLMYS